MADDARRAGDSWIVVALRLGVAGLAAVAATWEAATGPGMWAAAGGAAAGVIAGEVLSRTRARLTLAALAGVALVALGALGWVLLTRSPGLATAAGAGVVLELADAIVLGGIASGLCLVARATGARLRVAAALEIACYGAALAAPLAAHRGGAINRPLAIGDYAWSQGQDPVIYLQIAGGAAAVGLALFLIAERRWIRALGAAVLVLLATVGMGLAATLVAPPSMRTDAGLGLTGQGEEEGQGGKRGSRSLDQLDFRDNYGSQRQQAPVAVVLLHDDYEPPSNAYYFRQNAFSRYDGTRMAAALDARVDRDVFPYFPSAKREAAWIPPAEYRVPIKTSVALLEDHVSPVVLESAQSVAPAKNPSPRRFRRAYIATSLALDVGLESLLGKTVGDPAWPPEVLELYTEAPADPRYRALADEWIKTLPPELQGDLVARAVVIADELGKRGTYSLRSKHATARDPTASFLFGDVTGYCVYFAHAAVFLFRTAGVPTRLATGYQYPANLRGRGSALLLRGSDAHAWPEIYVDGVGWVVMDIAPAKNAEPPGMPLDPELQRMLGEMLRGQLEDQRRASLDIGEGPVAVSQVLEVLQAAARGLLLALAAALLGLGLVKSYRRLAPRISRPAHRTRTCYRAALDRLSDVGQRRRFGEPPELFAARVAAVAPSLAALVRAASARTLGSRRPDDPAAAFESYRRVAREIRRNLPWWRRALGAVDPVSWTRVR
jgi:transglutaminase-like putative cysteine protease